MAKDFDQLDQHVIAVCAPMQGTPSSGDVTSWDFVPGDIGTEVVIIPERYFYGIAKALYDQTVDLGVYWNTYEEDWIEGSEAVKKFADACRRVAEEKTDWPSATHRELVFAISALAERAAIRNMPVIVKS